MPPLRPPPARPDREPTPTLPIPAPPAPTTPSLDQVAIASPRVMRSPRRRRAVLFTAGIALAASPLMPVHLDPLALAWEGDAVRMAAWPLLAAVTLLWLALQSPRDRAAPWTHELLLFGVTFGGLQILRLGPFALADGTVDVGWRLYTIGLPLLLLGLRTRRSAPDSGAATALIAVGAGCLVPAWMAFLDDRAPFDHLGPLVSLHHVLHFFAMLVGIACLVHVAPPTKLPPALRGFVDRGPARVPRRPAARRSGAGAAGVHAAAATAAARATATAAARLRQPTPASPAARRCRPARRRPCGSWPPCRRARR